MRSNTYTVKKKSIKLTALTTTHNFSPLMEPLMALHPKHNQR